MKISHVNGNVYRGSQPKNVDDLLTVHRHGVDTIICLQEGFKMWEFEENFWINGSSKGKKYFHFSLSNFFAPTYAEVQAILDIIEMNESKGVYIHCLAGVDRTGFISGCLSVQRKILSPELAWEYIKDTGMHFWYYGWKNKFLAIANKL